MIPSRASFPLALLAALALAACERTVTKTVEVTAQPSTYLVEYLPEAMGGEVKDATVGKTTFQLRVRRRADFAPAPGLAIALHPVMTMAGMTHATPVDVVTESATPGTYDCTVYYLMASGAGMGYWELVARVAGEDVSFYPEVAMAMGGDTVRRDLWGASDAGMGAMAANKYFLFVDGPLSASAGTLRLFVARAEDMLMTFKAVAPGVVLAGSTGTVSSVALTASATTDFVSEVAATHAGQGHYELDLSSFGLTAGGAAIVHVKLAVNGEAKTTDGAAAGASNGYATFTVTAR